MASATIAGVLLEAERGPFSSGVVKASEEQRVAWFVVYSASRLPARGADHRLDVASPDVLEKACWRFAENGLRIGVGHLPGGERVAHVVENYVHRGTPWVVIGPDGSKQVVKAGDWVVALRFSKKSWPRFKAGEWGGVSLQGTATRKPASEATLARQQVR